MRAWVRSPNARKPTSSFRERNHCVTSPKEVALYAHVEDLPAHITECPHASEAYRGEIQQLLYNLEENHPGTRHSILSGYEELASIVAREYSGEDGAELRECAECGSTTTREICRKCSLLESLA